MKKVNPMKYNYNAQAKERRNIKPDDEGYVLTVPDQSLSIQTLFEKFRKTGQVPVVPSLEGSDQEIGDDEDPESAPDMEAIARMDKMDQIELARDVAKDVARKKSVHYDALKKAGDAEAKKRKAELDDAVKASLAAEKAEAERKAKGEGDAKK